MRSTKIILASIALLLILLAFLGYIFQADLEAIFSQTKEQATVSPVAEIAKDTIPYKEYLKKELGVIEVKKNRKSSREVWRLGKGPAIINYLLKAQNHIRLYEGKILDMEQTYVVSTDKNPTYQSATLDFIDFKGDTINIELQISNEIFVDGSSKLAIIFEGTNYDEYGFEQLSKQEYPFTLLLTPAEIYPDTNLIRDSKRKAILNKQGELKKQKALPADFNVSRLLDDEMKKFNSRISIRQTNINILRNNPYCSIVIWPYLESTKLNSTHSSPIRMYHTKAAIDEAVRTSLEQFPDAKGMATRMGEQAVEHPNFLRALLEPIQDKSLIFLDLTAMQSSMVNSVCNEYSLTCDAFTPYNPDNSTIEYYITKTLKEARKYGNTVMILPLKKDIWKYLQNIKEQASTQGTEIIPLTDLIHLRQ